MDKDKNVHGEGCMCGMCGGGLWGHHHWGHMLIKLIIVLFIFWAGVQFGELKSMVENSYYSGMMGGWGGQGGNMMYYNSLPQGSTVSSWAEPTGGVSVQMMRVSTSTR